MKDLLVATVSQQGGKLLVSIVRKTRAVEALKKTFGKTLLFTDREDMAPEEIVSAYRGKNVC